MGISENVDQNQSYGFIRNFGPEGFLKTSYFDPDKNYIKKFLVERNRKTLIKGGVRGLRFCGSGRFFVRFFGFPKTLMRFFGF